MKNVNRRHFLKASGITLIPAVIPFSLSAKEYPQPGQPPGDTPFVKFYGDGATFEPVDYLNELQKAQSVIKLTGDRYGSGGNVEELEKKFIEITGKEKAIFMPTGTMANQLSVSTLAGENTKVFVHDSSHMYRDEADAAQSIYNKRLVPLAAGKPYFTAKELQDAIENMPNEEVFKSGIGTVAIENPVRRYDGRFVPIEEIKKISAYCRSNNIKMHLDGARIFMASAWSGTSVKEYASYFDTIYISLYKYLGAGAGAILCGDKAVIDKMPHLMKVHGGAMYSNWMNAAMALYRLQGFEARLQDAVKRSAEIFTALNKSGIKVTQLENGTNIYRVELSKQIDGKKLQEKLRKEYNIGISRPDANNRFNIMVNETLTYQPVDYVVNAFKKSM